jgi:hypothetical protein
MLVDPTLQFGCAACTSEWPASRVRNLGFAERCDIRREREISAMGSLEIALDTTRWNGDVAFILKIEESVCEAIEGVDARVRVVGSREHLTCSNSP